VLLQMSNCQAQPQQASSSRAEIGFSLNFSSHPTTPTPTQPPRKSYFPKLSYGSETSDITFEGWGEMFKGDSADMCGRKFQLMSMWGRAEGLECADLGVKTSISMSLKLHLFLCFQCPEIKQGLFGLLRPLKLTYFDDFRGLK
jgi:hypothetical protein